MEGSREMRCAERTLHFIPNLPSRLQLTGGRASRLTVRVRALRAAQLRKAFEGLPKLSSHAVEEFLFLFDLNHMGEIEQHSFVEQAQHLGVLSHRVEAHA